MKILCCGCSFTYGDELPDLKLSWPYKLGEMINADEIINLGKPASSNLQILQQVIRGVNQYNPDVVFVQWSLLYRTAHSDDNGEYVVWPGRKFLGDVPPLLIEHAKWVTSYNNPKWYAEQHHFNTVLLDHFLTARGIPFVHVDFDSTNPYWEKEYDPYLKQEYYFYPEFYISLQNKKENICEWYAPHPKAKGGHPLEEGHEKIAKKYYEHCRNICGIS